MTKRYIITLRVALATGGGIASGFMLDGCNQPRPEVPPKQVSAPPSSPIHFTDVAAQSGINYRWTVTGKRPLNILQTIGNGCAFFDFNNDGNLDILLIGPNLGLYQGDGHGKFKDVSSTTGVGGIHGKFLGCAVGDYDGDGFDDVYISGFQTGLLLRNDRGKRFVDVTPSTGLAAQPWGTSCAWSEMTPGSSKLDLYIANYAAFVPGSPKYQQLCNSHGMLTSCGPRYYKPLHGVFYRQTGPGKFSDASQVLGIAHTSGRGLGVAFGTIDDSGHPTLALANDEMPGDLLAPSKGGGPYQNIASSAGTAYDRDGNIHGGMGTDWGDYDNDGKLDLAVMTFQGETKSLYHNDGNNLFTDASYQTGIAPPTIPNVAFGCKFLDVDNDGWLDLVITNGHVQDNIHAIDTSTDYRQPAQLFRNQGSAPVTFADLSSSAGPDFSRAIVGRGLAIGDYDNDGKPDVLIVDSEGVPLLLHNESQQTGHWLGVNLIGTQCNRDGYGAVLTLVAGGKKYIRECQSCGSYLSASDKRVHFGLGSATAADTLTITWPGGHVDTIQNVAADRYVTVKEGSGIVGR